MATPQTAPLPPTNPLRIANPPLTVGDLVRAEPGAVRVLQRHGIDFCCGGGKPLADVCAKAGVSVDALLAEVSQNEDDAPDWQALPIAALTQQIIQRFHAPLEEELPRLVAMADKVLRVHGDKDPERLAALADTVRALRDDLVPHMHKEEVVLFPMLVAGAGQLAQMPIAVMHQEHDAVGELLAKVRELTDGFVPPLAACATWKALYQGLEGLEFETHEHIHVENNILFPKALARTDTSPDAQVS